MNTIKYSGGLSSERDRKTRVSIHVFLLVLYAIIAISIGYSIAGTEEVKENIGKLRWGKEIKGCDIYVEYNNFHLFANQIDDRSLQDPDPTPKGKYVIGYNGQGVESQYNFSVSLFVYDISDDFFFFEDDDDIYSKNYKKYEEAVQYCGYDHWIFDINNIKTISFETKKNVERALFNDEGNYFSNESKVRSVFFANKKAYVLDVVSPKEAREHTSKILKSLTINKWSKKVYYSIINIVLFSIVLIIIQYRIHKRKASLNKAAHALFVYCIICAIVNIYLFVVFCNNLAHAELLLLWGLTIMFNLLSIWFFNSKSKYEFASDFMLSLCAKHYLDKHSRSESERRSVIAFVIYPFWVAGQLPFGFLILLYVVPLALFTILGMEFRNLFHWLNGESKIENRNANNPIFKDYYLILDLTNDATPLDIEKAFNQQMAHYYSTAENYQRKDQWIDLQEAYKILISENRLRPAYDQEYLIYDKGEYLDSYIIANKKLERDILIIRQSLQLQIESDINRRHFKINIVVVSFVLWLIILVCGYIILYDDSSNHHRRVHISRPFIERPERPY